MDKYECSVCGYIYDPEEGDPDNGIEPGTSFEDFLTTGFVLFAERLKISSRSSNKDFCLHIPAPWTKERRTKK